VCRQAPERVETEHEPDKVQHSSQDILDITKSASIWWQVKGFIEGQFIDWSGR